MDKPDCQFVDFFLAVRKLSQRFPKTSPSLVYAIAALRLCARLIYFTCTQTSPGKNATFRHPNLIISIGWLGLQEVKGRRMSAHKRILPRHLGTRLPSLSLQTRRAWGICKVTWSCTQGVGTKPEQSHSTEWVVYVQEALDWTMRARLRYIDFLGTATSYTWSGKVLL